VKYWSLIMSPFFIRYRSSILFNDSILERILFIRNTNGDGSIIFKERNRRKASMIQTPFVGWQIRSSPSIWLHRLNCRHAISIHPINCWLYLKGWFFSETWNLEGVEKRGSGVRQGRGDMTSAAYSAYVSIGESPATWMRPQGQFFNTC
jgi:hypothetical protein